MTPNALTKKVKTKGRDIQKKAGYQVNSAMQIISEIAK